MHCWNLQFQAKTESSNQSHLRILNYLLRFSCPARPINQLPSITSTIQSVQHQQPDSKPSRRWPIHANWLMKHQLNYNSCLYSLENLFILVSLNHDNHGSTHFFLPFNWLFHTPYNTHSLSSVHWTWQSNHPVPIVLHHDCTAQINLHQHFFTANCLKTHSWSWRDASTTANNLHSLPTTTTSS